MTSFDWWVLFLITLNFIATVSGLRRVNQELMRIRVKHTVFVEEMRKILNQKEQK